ncbi:tRNA dihydrouridine synthase DusB [Bowdeniella nasicola]|uniref:tRNA dihydrouridine synthase DusB n=1 Tax=Bowdeniella nasicola TaxID=208480 RepID=A0A1Q5Q331_9ACTO|nr:tRNA dihydrouridine synthase DusB [Bowdeniella nasicola]OKL54072.1 tRNA dihydrouridine synthase DusB [Bowdeniella nasicola]
MMLKPLHLGPIEARTPVVLAPMAGVTTPPFRRLCREAGIAGYPGDAPASDLLAPAGLYVTEMVTSRALVERHPATMLMVEPDPLDPVRSVQLYGVDPATIAEAIRILISEDRAYHIDLNFGCPVPKVTRRGGGAALPWKIGLFGDIVRRAVAMSERESRPGRQVPVTVKMRMGIDDDHITYHEAARVARDAGIAAVGLHARTAAQHYSGTARWVEIARLKEAMGDYPVLGNGDIWSAEDALVMVEQTGCDGVVIGRGCQGRPWLFTDIVAAFHGSDTRVRPGLAEVCNVVYRHAELMVEHFSDELKAAREMRKHMGWYFKGYPVGGTLRHRLAMVENLAELRALLDELDQDAPYPGESAEGPRGRAGHRRRPHLPDGWLDSQELSEAHLAALHEAEVGISGG